MKLNPAVLSLVAAAPGYRTGKALWLDHCGRLKPGLAIAVIFGIGLGSVKAADQFFAGDGNALNASKWGPDGGSYESTFTAGNVAHFNVTNGTGSGSISISVSGIIATENFTNSSTTGTLSTGGTVAVIDVSAGKFLNFGASSSVSTAAGTGFIKNGNGALSFTGSAFAGGFTLNAGTMIARGGNSLGNGALTLNGGIVAADGNQDFSGKFSSISIGGNIQFNDNAFALENAASNLIFSNNIALGGSTRTLTNGGSGTVTFGGIISNSATSGLTFASNANGTGRFDVTNTANTFSGDLKITGGEVRFTDAGSVGNVNNNIIIDGGRFATADNTSYSLASTHAITIGDTVGTAISTSGSSLLAYAGVITDISGKTGEWAKQGGGTLVLGGVSTYSGNTAINNGTLQLTTGNDRLPTATTVSLGQSSSTNLGKLDLNGFSQQIAGLNSVTGTNATASNNTVTSSSAATLTIGGTGTYSYGAGTDANSGVITGANLKLVKSGNGTQTLGDVNTYGGGTDINGGTLAIANASALGTSGTISFGGGTLQYNSLTTDLSSRFSTAASQAYSINTNGNNVAAATALTSTGGTFIKTGNGTLTFSGAANSYSGLTTVSGGTLALEKSAGTHSIAGDLTINGGTVNYGGNDSQIADTSNVTLSSGSFDLGARSETISSLTMTGGSLNRQSNALVLSNASSITGGTLTFTSTSSRITAGGALTLGGATFNYSSATDSGDGLLLGGDLAYASGNTAAAAFNNSSTGVGRINLQGATRTFDVADSTTLGSGLAEVQVWWSVQNGGLTKSGGGMLSLSATNTYSGATTINGGILAVNGSLASGSAVTVNPGGTLGGSGTVGGSVAVKSGGIVGPGNSPGVLTTGAATFETGSIFSWELSSDINRDGVTSVENPEGVRGTNFDGLAASSLSVASNAIFRVVLTGTADVATDFWNHTQEWNNIFSVSGTTVPAAVGMLFNKFEVYSGTTDITAATTSGQGSFSFSSNTLTWTAVPEPTSALAGVLLGVGLFRRRRSMRG